MISAYSGTAKKKNSSLVSLTVPLPVKQGSQTQLPLSIGTWLPFVQGSSHEAPIQPFTQFVHRGGVKLELQWPEGDNWHYTAGDMCIGYKNNETMFDNRYNTCATIFGYTIAKEIKLHV